MKLESYIAKQSKEERDLGPEPKERLSSVINKPLTPENINTYFEEALNETAELAERVRKTYEHIRRHPRLTTAQVEDRAFSHFGLQAIPEILTLIEKKRAEISEVNLLLQSRIQQIPEVIVPPDRQRPGIVAGSGTYEAPDVLNRLKTLLYVLKEDGVDISSLTMKQGQIADAMMRKISYVSVEIPALNRLGLICDEEGNVSYFLDLKRIAESKKMPREYLEMTKDTLNAAIASDPTLGIKLRYSQSWIERIREALHEPFLEGAPRPEPSDIPQVSTTELDPWRNFYLADDGKHYGTINAISERMRSENIEGSTDKTLERRIRRLPTQNIMQVGRVRVGYSYEDAAAAVEDLLSRPQVAESGEWEGFHEINDEHFGSATAIGNKLNLASTTITGRVKELNLPAVPLRDLAGKKIDGYSYEKVAESYSEFLSRPVADEGGEWMGLYAENNIHYGSITAILRRLDREHLTTNRPVVDRYIKEQSISHRDIQSAGGEPVEAYPYETVREYIRTFLSYPLADQTGEWAGFAAIEEKHWGSPKILARKMDIGRAKIREVASNANLPTKHTRDHGGHEYENAYALEDVQPLFADFFALPRAESSGEWSGFILHEGKHYAPIGTIRLKLGRGHNVVESVIKNANLASIQMRDTANKPGAGYAYEDVESRMREVYSDPRVALEGEWKGFSEINGEHFAPIPVLAERLKIGTTAVRNEIRRLNLTPVQIRELGNQQAEGFSFEALSPTLSSLASLPQVDRDGEWKGFTLQNEKHYGSIRALANKFHTTHMVIAPRVKKLSTLSIRGETGVRTEGYAYEDLENEIKAFFELPAVAGSGGWRGFYERDGKHYGAALTIAERLKGVSKPTILKRMVGKNIESIDVRDLANKQVVAYAIEDIEPFVQDLIEKNRT